MKKNILLIIGIAIFLIPNICLAKTITIDGNDYSTSSVLEKDNFTYKSTDNILILKNLTFKSIKTDEDLKIILEGKNYLTNTTGGDGITANSLEITGDGSLDVDTTGRFLIAKKITINKITLKINSKGVAFTNVMCDGPIYQDILISNSNLEVVNASYLVNSALGNLYFINSKIKVSKIKKITDGIVNTNMINSDIRIEEADAFTFSGEIFVNNSNFYIHSLNNKFANKNYTLVSSNLIFQESDDGSTWTDASLDNKPAYLKITSTNSSTDLSDLEKSLKEKEELLNKKEEDLRLKENNLDKRENDLDIREQELNSKEENLNSREEYLNNYAFKLENLEEELSNKSLELEETRKNLLLLEEGLNLKETELNQGEISLNQEKSKLEELNSLLKSKQEELEKEKSSLELRAKELESLNEKMALLEEYEVSLNKREEEITREEEDVVYRVSNNTQDIIKTSNIVEDKKSNKIVLFGGLTFIMLIGLTSLIWVLRRKSATNR